MSFLVDRLGKQTVLALAIMFVFGGSLRADGAGDFKAKCAMCHGADGSGTTATGKALKLRDLGSSDVQSQADGRPDQGTGCLYPRTGQEVAQPFWDGNNCDWCSRRKQREVR
jgi:hypothetical protein